MKQLFILLFSLLLAMPTYADTARYASAQTEEFKIYYRFDDTRFDLTYLSNRQTSERIREYLLKSPRIDSIMIYSWSSPEGGYPHNAKLSRQRAVTAKQFLLSHSPDSLKLDSDKIRISPMAENWPGLAELVRQNYHRHDREKVLDIINEEGVGEETRKWRLQQLDKGYTWSYLIRHYMPQLRTATWICVWAKVDTIPQLKPVSGKAHTSAPAIAASLGKTSDSYAQRIPLAALRTNLLVPALNFGVEVPLGNRWSVAADYYYPWFWPNKNNRNCFEFLGWSAEARYWFGKDRSAYDRLKGHSLGLYVAGGYYDFENNFRGMQGEFVSPGLDYTYSMAVGRSKRLHLEFTLAVGYIRSWGKTYNVFGDYGDLYPDEGTVIWDYIGPTKAAVSLVVPLYKKEGRK